MVRFWSVQVMAMQIFGRYSFKMQTLQSWYLLAAWVLLWELKVTWTIKLIRNLSQSSMKFRTFSTKKLKILQNDNSATGSINTFKVIFLDSKIASKMELGKDKLKYVVNYGIAPFFAERLKKHISESEWLAVCYNESLNKIIQ